MADVTIRATASGESEPRATPRTPQWPVLAAGAVLAIGLSYVFMLVYSANPSWMYDMHVFRKTGRLVLEGGTVYWDHPRSLFTHTPFNALLCVPVAVLPLPVVAVAWNAVELFCLQVVGWLSLRAAGVTGRAALLGGAVAVALAAFVFDPLYIDLLLGQYKVVCLSLLLIELLVLRNSRWQGLITGALSGLYLLPGLFAVFFLVSRRMRAAWLSLVGFAVTVVIGFAALPSDSMRYWSGLFLDTTRVGGLQNVRAQSVFNLAARWLHTKELGWWIAVGVVVIAVAAVAAAVRLDRRGDYVPAVYLVGLATVLASPIAWNHHFVWAVPTLVLLGVAAARRRSWPLALLVAVSVANFVAAPYERFRDHDAPANVQLDWLPNVAASTFALNVVVLIGALLLFRSQPGKPETDGSAPEPAPVAA